MRVSLGHHHRESVIFLKEDVFVVMGDTGRGETPPRSAWPPDGAYGPIPSRAVIGRLREVLDSIGPELWQAKRRGSEARLIRQRHGRPNFARRAT
jgi:hypothetical protein